MDTVDCGSWAELEAPATAVRRAVFVAEQGVDESEELDGRDADAHHVVAYEDGTPVGTARLRLVDDAVAKAERVAVFEAHRETGVGTALMAAVEDIATERGATRMRLHAQTRVREFYERLGYEAVGEEFEEADIPHVAMVKEL
jgi:predicted GNAT family N-acyltransferase